MPRCRPPGTRLRPPRLLLATEPVRAGLGLAAWPLTASLSLLAPRGDGSPVLVLPGLLASDLSTRPLRAWLRALGYHVHGWRLGRNLGPTSQVEAGLRDLLGRLSGRHGCPIALVGWSLGGIYARAAAAGRPELVRSVITLGTPFALQHPRQTTAYAGYRRLSHLHAPGHQLRAVPARIRGPLQVPSTSIWSREDGIVSWVASLEQPSASAENIAVHGSHLGLGHNPAVLWAVADRLAQPADRWRPFAAPRWLQPLYPDPSPGAPAPLD